jgi:hypothetical protein
MAPSGSPASFISPATLRKACSTLKDATSQPTQWILTGEQWTKVVATHRWVI